MSTCVEAVEEPNALRYINVCQIQSVPFSTNAYIALTVRLHNEEAKWIIGDLETLLVPQLHAILTENVHMTVASGDKFYNCKMLHVNSSKRTANSWRASPIRIRFLLLR